MLLVRKKTLIILAGLLWLAAGINIMRIGVIALLEVFQEGNPGKIVLLSLLTLLIFVGFLLMFFRIVVKHCKRIMGYQEERKPFYYFFDVKGYILMVFMMILGIGLRRSGLLPVEFFAFFYSGLGSALSIAGLKFLFSDSR